MTLEICDDDAKNDGIQGEEGVTDISGITPMNECKLSMDHVGGSNELKSSNVPMERTFAHLCDVIQIIEKCKQKRAMFCDHATSFMRIMALDIRNIHFTKANG